MPGRRISPSGQTQKKDRRPGRTGAGVAGAEAAGEGSGGDGSKSLGGGKEDDYSHKERTPRLVACTPAHERFLRYKRYDPLI